MNRFHVANQSFAQAVESVGGEVIDRLVTHTAAFCRALVPLEEEVQPNDALRYGAALRADSHRIQVVPYVLRRVCSNGAMWAQCGSAFSLETAEETSEVEIVAFVASSTAKAASRRAFRACLEEIRTGMRSRVHFASTLMTLIGQGGPDWDAMMVEILMREVSQRTRTETRYDAMNAVTAAAREVRDPELKWKMETLATTLLIGVEPERKDLPSSRSRNARSDASASLRSDHDLALR